MLSGSFECRFLLQPQTGRPANVPLIFSLSLTFQAVTSSCIRQKACQCNNNFLTPGRRNHRSRRERPIGMPGKVPKVLQRHTFHMPVEEAHVNSAKQWLRKIYARGRHIGPMRTMSGNQVSINPLTATRSWTIKPRLQVVSWVVNSLA